ncbi:hypothetical protein [Infirmifilum uzonense]|uniref:hypothetical protein n=1 Tax=Infirmifilum uzonense TaxID=1550241 RepID=UPI000AF36EE2|nr:hypothetical protein [Infirmifilum uzonense]
MRLQLSKRLESRRFPALENALDPALEFFQPPQHYIYAVESLPLVLQDDSVGPQREER